MGYRDQPNRMIKQSRAEIQRVFERGNDQEKNKDTLTGMEGRIDFPAPIKRGRDVEHQPLRLDHHSSGNRFIGRIIDKN